MEVAAIQNVSLVAPAVTERCRTDIRHCCLSTLPRWLAMRKLPGIARRRYLALLGQLTCGGDLLAEKGLFADARPVFIRRLKRFQQR